MFNSPANFLSYHGSHAAADESKIHNGKYNLMVIYPAGNCANSIRETCFFLSISNLLAVFLLTAEFQGVNRTNTSRDFLKIIIIQKQLKIFFSTNPKMMRTGRANMIVLFKLTAINHL